MKFRKSFVIAGIIVLVIAMSCGGGSEKDTAKPPKTGCDINAAPVFSSSIPHEVNVTLQDGYSGLVAGDQPCFDIFSWQSFIALNWPADSLGIPMPGNFSDQPSMNRVWEYYQDPSQVFQTMEYLQPFEGPVKMQRGMKGFYQFAKTRHELVGLSPSIIEATGQPLIDKNLNYALYEIKMNPDEVNYINANGLNTKEGQVGKKIAFPMGNKDSVGAIEIKATWKIMVPGVDDTTKFYCRRASIYVPAMESANGKPLYLTETVGLVAMHILHKTTNFPFWIWTTFEQVSNAPQQGNTSGSYSFFNPACTTCANNTPPPAAPGNNYLWQPSKPYAKAYATNGMYGTQVVRTDTVYGPTDAVNKTWQTALAKMNSVFANYRLIGSQWSVKQDVERGDTIAAPANLANTTLETYLQVSSCTMTCHRSAKDAAGNMADFSFLLGHAKATALIEEIRKRRAMN